MVEIEVANRSGAELDLGAAAELVREVLAAEGLDDGEVGLQLVGPEEMRALKREHLGVDEPTDALAFPIDGRDTLPEGLPRQSKLRVTPVMKITTRRPLGFAARSM